MNCDIIGFQEVFSQDELKALIFDCGYKEFIVVDEPKLDENNQVFKTTTVALASKFPVKKVEKVDTISKLTQVQSLIPLTLYFNNDDPDPKSNATTTDKNYRLTISNYIAAKEKFKQEYSKGLSTEEQQIANQAIETFFKDSVEKGYMKAKRKEWKDYLEQVSEWELNRYLYRV